MTRCRLENGNWKLETGKSKLEAGNHFPFSPFPSCPFLRFPFCPTVAEAAEEEGKGERSSRHG